MQRAIGILATTVILGGCVGVDPPLTGDEQKESGEAADATAPGASGGCKGDGCAPLVCAAEQTSCGAVCASLANDPDHCGVCGHSCGGAGCDAGRCAVKKVVAGASFVSLALGKTDVFVRSSYGGAFGAVASVPKVGGALAPIADASGWSDLGGQTLATVGDDLYFMGQNSGAQAGIFRRSFASPTLVASVACAGGAPCRDLLTDGSFFAWNGPSDVGTCTAPCTSVLSIAATNPVTALHAARLFWTDGAGGPKIRTCARPDCATQSTFSAADDGQAQLAWLTVFRDTLYWVDNHIGDDKARVFSCPVLGCVAPKVLVSGEYEIDGLAVAASGIYLSHAGRPSGGDPDGYVKVCRDLVAGCGAGADVLTDVAPNPSRLAVDGDFVYWIAGGVDGVGAGLYRVAR